MKQVESVLAIARAAEQAVRMELMQMTALAVERKGIIDAREATIEELTDKVQAAEELCSASKKKVADIKGKCHSLSQQYEEEREKRCVAI